MPTIPIEVSARHAHLKAEDWQILFGTTEPTVGRTISQPPQFVAKERLTLIGPGGQIPDIGIVGPIRPYTQVELAMTDARRLGIKPPLSDSGKLEQAAELTFIGPAGTITRPAAIIQQRHIHTSPEKAAEVGLSDRQIVSVRISGPRGGVLDNVLVRIHEHYTWQMHIDTDEANAFGVDRTTVGEIIVN